jgi:2-methylaconitate cis-trans-isomerase PrpF
MSATPATAETCTSAVDPFAIHPGLVKKKHGLVMARIRNTNANKLIHSTFPVNDGEAVAHVDFAIDLVSGTAARIELVFLGPDWKVAANRKCN